MAYIYKITNLINNRIYIGKTNLSVEQRWKQHIRDSRKKDCMDRPLYRAINKYNISNFIIEPIEECSEDAANEREKYWIEYYGSFKNGYNATIGGDGKPFLDYDVICETYNKTKNMNETAKICKCDAKTVSYILKSRNVEILSAQQVTKNKTSKIINQYDKNNNYIQTFSSITDAARYIQSLEPEKRTDRRGIAQHISDVAKGKRRTAYKYIWKFKDE